MKKRYEIPESYSEDKVRDIKYFVRTTGERKFNYKLDYELLVDKEKKSFIKQLKEIARYDSVLLEDDLKLCKNFKERVEEVIKQYPKDIINFFYAPYSYFPTHVCKEFFFNQCTYYPKEVTLQLAYKMEEIHNSLEKKVQYDVLENMALKELGIRHIVYRPCLVQHKDLNSIIQNNVTYRRISPFFVDYLDDLHIDYKDANREHSLKLLNKRLEREFKNFELEEKLNG